MFRDMSTLLDDQEIKEIQKNTLSMGWNGQDIIVMSIKILKIIRKS